MQAIDVRGFGLGADTVKAGARLPHSKSRSGNFRLVSKAQCGIGGGVLRLVAIWVRRSRRESPISEKALVQVSRSFSSAVAAIPETTSPDWWSSEAKVAS